MGSEKPQHYMNLALLKVEKMKKPNSNSNNKATSNIKPK
jgi:hypothetical protein